MDALERLMKKLLADAPELSFRDVCAELLAQKALEYHCLEDPYFHTALHGRYARAKVCASVGRVNTEM